jgi:signal transduction histidine kinase
VFGGTLVTQARDALSDSTGISSSDGSPAARLDDLPPEGTERPAETSVGLVRLHGLIEAVAGLTEKHGGGDSTVDDGALVQALAAAAGIAVENARLSQELRRKQRWLDALAEIRAALLLGSDASGALLLIAARGRELTGADAVLLLLPDAAAPDEQLMVAVADGGDAANLRGVRTPVGSSIAGRVYRSGQALSVADVTADDTREPVFDQRPGYGPALFAPLGGPAEMGVLVVANPAGAPALSPEAADFAIDFAGQAAVALRMDDAHRARQELALLADRDRIARDLHDQVIQRLFATGMGLETVTRLVTEPTVQARLHRAVDDLDRTIRDIRGTIYELQAPSDVATTLRQQMNAVVLEAMGASDLDLQLDVADSVDAVVPPEVSGHALAVLRQAVTNVVRHARATGLSVAITATDRLRIEVTDDGVGFPEGGRRSGLAPLTDCAAQLGGELRLGRNATGAGALLTWEVPLPAGRPAGPVPA